LQQYVALIVTTFESTAVFQVQITIN